MDRRSPSPSAGVELFARYAHAPDALGLCGPSSGVGGAEDEVRAAARRFFGAWPYLQVLARLTGTDDPLDERLVEAYWLGRDLGVDRAWFGAELLAVIGPQAGRYWTHLTPSLLAEGSPDHGFHVFGVYPWSRLLGAGPEPLHVLDGCRIGWGAVLSRHGDEIEAASQRLTWDGAKLDLAPTSRTQPTAAPRSARRFAQPRAQLGARLRKTARRCRGRAVRPRIVQDEGQVGFSWVTPAGVKGGRSIVRT